MKSLTRKIIWRVSLAPTGRYRSFERRGWPTARYEKPDLIAAAISCEDEYYPRDVRGGKHAPLTVRIADYGTPNGNCLWSWRKLKGTFATLDEAKSAFARVLAALPQIAPKEDAK
jgi:hypothetical protein